MPGSAIQRRRIAMRNAKLAMLVLLAGSAAIAGPTPAAAVDYPYCIQGGGWGVPGDCAYRSYAECQASLSGRYGYCNINPRVAFARQQHRRPHRDYGGRY
jgi:Protein of unknown function (DUF3551)